MNINYAGPKVEPRCGVFKEKDITALSNKYCLNFAAAISLANYLSSATQSNKSESRLYEYLLSIDFQLQFASFAKYVVIASGNPSYLIYNEQSQPNFLNQLIYFTLEILNLLGIKKNKETFEGETFADQDCDFRDSTLPNHWSNDEDFLNAITPLKFDSKNEMDKMLFARLIRIVDKAKYEEFPICDINDRLTRLLKERVEIIGYDLGKFIIDILLPIAQRDNSLPTILAQKLYLMKNGIPLREIKRGNLSLSTEA